MKFNKEIHYQFYYRPGKWMSDLELSNFTKELMTVAKECFSEVPLYQALTGERDELERCVLIVARNKNKEAVGFCSSLLLKVDEVRDVLHLGLTCTVPRVRGKGLTRKLLTRLIVKTLLKEFKLGGIWFSNVACVISSLSNVSIYFEKVYPSFNGEIKASKTHQIIAEKINRDYRKPLAINENAIFDKENFVFKGSVKDSVFSKKRDDKQYFHRNKKLTRYYQGIIDFDRGDEVLQVGMISLFSYPKYLLKLMIIKIKTAIKFN